MPKNKRKSNFTLNDKDGRRYKARKKPDARPINIGRTAGLGSVTEVDASVFIV